MADGRHRARRIILRGIAAPVLLVIAANVAVVIIVDDAAVARRAWAESSMLQLQRAAGALPVLPLLGDEEATTPIRWAAALFDVENGIARAETAVIDTATSVLIVEGRVNLRDETLNPEVKTRAKDPSLLYLNRPVGIQGPFREPAFDAVQGAAPELVGSPALAALFQPAAALLPFLEFGGAESRECRALLQQAAG